MQLQMRISKRVSMKEFARRSIAQDSEAAKMLSSLEVAIHQMQFGKPVILLDADHREGEGGDELFAIGKEHAIRVLHIDTLLERQKSQVTA